MIKIQKHSTNFTLADVKNQILLHKPKINCQWKSWFGRNRWGWYYFEIAWKQHWNGMLVSVENKYFWKMLLLHLKNFWDFFLVSGPQSNLLYNFFSVKLPTLYDRDRFLFHLAISNFKPFLSRVLVTGEWRSRGAIIIPPTFCENKEKSVHVTLDIWV